MNGWVCGCVCVSGRDGSVGGSSTHIDSALIRYLELKITATKHQLLIITDFIRYSISTIGSFLTLVYEEIDAW